MKIIGIVGSNVPASTNRKLMGAVQTQLGSQADIDILNIDDVPVFTKPSDKKAPAVVAEIIKKLSNAAGVIIATPEYDHSVPAVLLNLLEWISYCSKALAGKPTMIIGASYGRLGADRAQSQLKQVLLSPDIDANLMPGEFLLGNSLNAFDDHGQLANTNARKALQQRLKRFVSFVQNNQ